MALDFLGRWAAVARFAVFGMRDGPEWNGVCQPELSRVDSSLLQHFAQRVAGRPDKGLALRGFRGAWRFTNQVQPRSPEATFRRDSMMIEKVVHGACLGHRFPPSPIGEIRPHGSPSRISATADADQSRRSAFGTVSRPCESLAIGGRLAAADPADHLPMDAAEAIKRDHSGPPTLPNQSTLNERVPGHEADIR